MAILILIKCCLCGFWPQAIKFWRRSVSHYFAERGFSKTWYILAWCWRAQISRQERTNSRDWLIMVGVMSPTARAMDNNVDGWLVITYKGRTRLNVILSSSGQKHAKIKAFPSTWVNKIAIYWQSMYPALRIHFSSWLFGDSRSGEKLAYIIVALLLALYFLITSSTAWKHLCYSSSRAINMSFNSLFRRSLSCLSSNRVSNLSCSAIVR